MKKTSIIFLIFVFALLGCDSANSSANKEFVKISNDMSELRDMYKCGDFASALKVAEDASYRLKSIVKNYPESSVAVRILSDKDIHLGDFKYEDLDVKIIPNLKLFSNEKVEEVNVVWAMIMGEKNSDIRDRNLVWLANWIHSYSKFTEPLKAFETKGFKFLDRKSVTAIYDTCLDNISDVKLQRSVLRMNRNIPSHTIQVADGKASVDIVDDVKTSDDVMSVKSSISKPDEFYSKARRLVVMITSQRDSTKKLMGYAIDAASNPNVIEEFKKILTEAVVSAKKLSLKKDKESALSDIGKCFCIVGDIGGAINLSEDISDINLRDELTIFIINNYALNKKFAEAKILISMISSEVAKDEVAILLSVTAAKGRKIDESIGMAKLIKDEKLRSRCFSNIAVYSTSIDESADILSNVKFEYLKAEDIGLLAKGLLGVSLDSSAEAGAFAFVYSNLAERFYIKNPKLGEDLMNRAMGYLSSVKKEELGTLVCCISRDLFMMKKFSESYEFLSKHSDLEDSSFINTICELGFYSNACGKKDLGEKFFKLALRSKDAEKMSIEIALYMQLSGVERKEIMNLLENSMPKL